MAKKDTPDAPPTDGTLLGDSDGFERTRAEHGQVHGITHHVASSGENVEVDADEHARLAGQPAIKVRATRLGYYGDKRRRIGDVFIIHGEALFSSKWMEKVDPRTPERLTKSKDDLKRTQDELRGRATGDAHVLKS